MRQIISQNVHLYLIYWFYNIRVIQITEEASLKHIFIINPAAGAKNYYENVKQAIEECGQDFDHEFYETTAPMDACAFIREYCRNYTLPVRFYACGGDGTLNEVVNGAAGFENAEVACVPTGSGNDYVKYYGPKAEFMNIANSIEGTPFPADLLKIGDRYSINVINFGFDSVVAETISKVKRKKIIGGKHSYTTGIVKGLVVGMKSKCVVTVDGEALNNDVMLLCTVANGTHVGGSFKCAPRSLNNDGLAEVSLFRPISRITFARLVKAYEKGEHLDDPRFAKYITYRRGKLIECESPEERFAVSVDGEMIYTNKFSIEVIPNAIKFVVPKTLVESYLAKHSEEPEAVVK